MNITLSKKGKLVAIVGAITVGYILYKNPKDASGDRNILIDYVYVKPAFRRKGIARALILEVLKRNKQAVWVSMWTGRQSEIDGSWKLYKKMGFTQQVIQKDYYEDGVAVRLFTMRLNT